MPVSRWLSIRPTLVSPGKASHIYTPRLAQVRERVQAPRAINTYTGRVPTVSISGGAGTVTVRVSWTDNGAPAFGVGYDSVTHAAEDRNDMSIYPNSYNVGRGIDIGGGERAYDILGWPSASTCYFAVNSFDASGNPGPWGTEAHKP